MSFPGSTRGPLEHPRAYAAGIDRRRLATVVAMEDIASCGDRPNVEMFLAPSQYFGIDYAATAPLTVS